VKATLDACVLYPTVMRQVLLGAAEAGLFTPLWSPRILEEWARAVARLGPADEAIARADIAQMRARWPAAEVTPPDSLIRRLHLPDENDIHVLASAIAGSADVIVTQNAADFPRGTLATEGLRREDADQFLRGLHDRAPDALAQVVDGVRATAERLSGEPWTIRALLKKAKLPRLAKVLG
jgi:predicted nucleic acid-binding protein